MVAKSTTTLQDATHDLEDRPHHSTADRCAACKVHQMHLEGLGDRRTPTYSDVLRPSITIERKICAFTFGGTSGSTTAADLPEPLHTGRGLIQSLDSNTGASGVRYERTRRRTNVRSRVQDAHDRARMDTHMTLTAWYATKGTCDPSWL